MGLILKCAHSSNLLDTWHVYTFNLKKLESIDPRVQTSNIYVKKVHKDDDDEQK